MPKKWILIAFLGWLFLAFSVDRVLAHGGHKKKTVEMEEPAPAVDSPYAVAGDSTDSSQVVEDDFSLSRANIFTEEPSETLEGMKHMDHQSSGAKDPTTHIEIAKREWVSPKQKGYGVAVGITIFAGLIFGVLSFKRPLE